jgi:hypothetical protein
MRERSDHYRTVVEIAFPLGDRCDRAWEQANATTKQLEKLASDLFGKKGSLGQDLSRESLEWTLK